MLHNQTIKALLIGLGFVIFGIGCLIQAVIFIVVSLLPVSQQNKQKIAQFVVKYAAKIFIFILTFFKIIKVNITIPDNINFSIPTLIIANHPTLIDILIILSFIPNVVSVYKEKLNSNFFISWVVKASGYLANDNTFVEEGQRKFNQDKAIVIFPEGTRSPAEGLGEFKLGAAYLAIKTKCQVVPIVIKCFPKFLMKQKKWYNAPKQLVVYDIIVDVPFNIDNNLYLNKNTKEAAQQLTRDFGEYYGKKV